MKRLILLLTVCYSLHHASAQKPYWQQQVNYEINVSLNDAKHSLSGFEKMEYINRSPDTLYYVWIHLWPNAYKNGRTAFSRQLKKIKDRSDKLEKLKEPGYIDSLHFMVNDVAAQVEPHSEYIDIVRLLLPQPLAPGSKAIITTPFTVKIPTYVSRLGYTNDTYMITQWYPKPAVYDRLGWHPIPYLDQGEFYSEYGNFDVSITLPSGYVVGATGLLHNTAELERYKLTGSQNKQADDAGKPHTLYTSDAKGMKTLRYTAENVHDFGWFADKNFIISYDTLQLPDQKTIDVFSFRQPDGNPQWSQSVDFIKDAVRHYSTWIGTYPYPSVNAVEGPKNGSSGGMEYPMITLITSPEADKERLDAVITHEVGHNWFYSILGSNERDHAWMDEGINSYYQFRYEAVKYRANSIFGNVIPDDVRKKDPDDFLSMVYNALGTLQSKWAVDTPSPDFTSGEDYGLTVYVKAAIWMYLMEKTIGKDKLDKGMQAYFNEWKFRHPYPSDMQQSLENATGTGLQTIFNLLNLKAAFK